MIFRDAGAPMNVQQANLLPNPLQLPLLLDTEQLARITGFAEQTIRHWANKTRPAPLGWPEPVKVGRAVRYRTIDIIQWVDGGCRMQPPGSSQTALENEPPTRRGRGRPRKGLAS